MKILFIGGTGRISASISRLLLAQGHELYLLNRGLRSQIPEGAIHLKGDINDEEGVASLIKGHHFDCVANFINFLPAQVARDIRLFSGKTEQYIFISSASAYQKPLSFYKITESTPLHNPYWEYSRNKILCEELLVKEYRNGFPMTIVRPSHTYDEHAVPVAIHGNNGPWQVLRRMLDGKKILVHGDGLSLWTLTHSRDFALAFAGLVGNIHAIGESVHITSDESLTWNQIHDLIGRALGVTPKPFYVPSSVLGLADKGFLGSLLGDKAHSVVFDNSKIKALVPGFNAAIRFDTGIADSVKTFLADPDKQKNDPDFDRLCDNIIQVYEEANEKILSIVGANS